MASATIIKAYHDGTTAFITALVDEGGNKGKVEYNASLPLADLTGTNAQKKTQLVAAVKAVRDAQIAPVPTDLSAIASGTVTI